MSKKSSKKDHVNTNVISHEKKVAESLKRSEPHFNSEKLGLKNLQESLNHHKYQQVISSMDELEKELKSSEYDEKNDYYFPRTKTKLIDDVSFSNIKNVLIDKISKKVFSYNFPLSGIHFEMISEKARKLPLVQETVRKIKMYQLEWEAVQKRYNKK